VVGIGGEPVLQWWNGDKRGSIPAHDGGGFALRRSPDQVQFVTFGFDGNIILWRSNPLAVVLSSRRTTDNGLPSELREEKSHCIPRLLGNRPRYCMRRGSIRVIVFSFAAGNTYKPNASIAAFERSDSPCAVRRFASFRATRCATWPEAPRQAKRLPPIPGALTPQIDYAPF
jgi:hypothetical protein